MSKHTPGPWRVENEDDDAISITAPSRRGMIEIAAIDLGFTDALDAEQTANARLIAAAPVMLEALKECEAFVIAWMSIYQHQHGLPNPALKHQETLEKLRAAIAKAEGR